MYLINDLEPKRMFNYFEDISRIPRGSGNEAAIADFICDFAAKKGLFCLREAVNNVFIRKEATKGYENVPAVMLQGHTDMVCEKNADTVHDFENDPLKLAVKNGWLYAEGTTLGGDDGAAVAAMLAFLEDDDLPHPTLECLFTSGEETSLVGANAFDYSVVTARRIINLDTELEGEAICSCAGSADVVLSVETDRVPIPYRALKITVKGLAGGHSGADIHLGRTSAIRVMGRALAAVYNENPFRLVSLEGGNKPNAIPRECVAQIVTNDVEGVKATLARVEKEIKAALIPDDKRFCIRVEKGTTEGTMVSFKQTSAAINCMTLTHNGVYAFMQDSSGFVRTSASMGIVRTEDDRFNFSIMARSSNDGEMESLLLTYQNLAKAIGAEFSLHGRSSGWDFDPSSRLAKDFVRIYKELFGENSDPKVNPIHAGLECGVIVSTLGEGCDALSIGPTIVDIHTPDERLDLASCDRFWKLLCAMVAVK